MLGWIGTHAFGVVDRVGPESIATDFYFAILPLWPRETRYRTTTRAGEPCAVPIRRQLRSVVLGYVRSPLWLATVVLAMPAIADFAKWGYLLAVAVPVSIAATLLTFVVGRLSDAERARRALLRRVVGIGAPPEMLAPATTSGIRDALGDEWATISDAPWHEAITRGQASELLVALAEYHGRHALAARARENLVARA